MIPSKQSVKPVRVVKNVREQWLVVDQQKAWEKERCICIKGYFNKDFLVSPEYNRFFSLKRASLVKERSEA